MQTLTHLSLFSGIGGLDLAAEGAGFRTVGQCEWADFPHAVLQKHWPDVPKWRDIHGLTADDFYQRTGLQSATCISGGFPCQPHSTAGKRKASGDERDLWPQMRRVIGELRPRWVVAENVRGLLSSEDGRFFAGVLRDFATLGYDVGWGIISAAAVGAVHRRERVAIVAHADCQRMPWWVLEEGWDAQGFEPEGAAVPILQKATADSISASGICGVDDGIPHRVDRLRCLGNAVVPQQFYPVFRAIADIERTLYENQ
ncbi:MAG: DNA cytosine methyltransferase [Oscillospiraceae bacterium]|nr:DNA cytosine methyltransferase [Oscillospiraceae bacterium]